MSSALSVFNGSMSVARNPARERQTIRTRKFLLPVWIERTSAIVLSQTSSPGPLGSTYASGHITIKPNDLLNQNAKEFIQNSDRYRISSAELFVMSIVDAKTNTTKSTAPIAHYAYVDGDTSESQTGGVTPWYDVTSRDNVSKCVLRANNPIIKVATWNPRPLFQPQTSNNPANIIPSKSSWCDSLYLDQEWNGVRTFSSCPTQSDQNDQYKFALYYELRVTIQTQAVL